MTSGSARIARLSRVPSKVVLYAEEGLDRREAEFPAVSDDFWFRHSAILIKPDALARRRTSAILDYLNDHGFTPRLSLPISLGFERAAFLWRYQWNTATRDRDAINGLLYERFPCTWVLLEDNDWSPGHIPATVRLRSMKGSSYPPLRNVEDLRYHVGGATRMLSAVHTPDEPIDLLREIALFGVDLAALASTESRWGSLGSARDVDRHALTAELSVAPHPLQILEASSAIRAATSGLIEWPEGTVVPNGWRRRDGSFDLQRFLTDGATALVPLWTLIVFASAHITADRVGVVCTIDDDGQKQWKAEAAAGEASTPDGL